MTIAAAIGCYNRKKSPCRFIIQLVVSVRRAHRLPVIFAEHQGLTRGGFFANTAWHHLRDHCLDLVLDQRRQHQVYQRRLSASRGRDLPGRHIADHQPCHTCADGRRLPPVADDQAAAPSAARPSGCRRQLLLLPRPCGHAAVGCDGAVLYRPRRHHHVLGDLPWRESRKIPLVGDRHRPDRCGDHAAPDFGQLPAGGDPAAAGGGLLCRHPHAVAAHGRHRIRQHAVGLYPGRVPCGRAVHGPDLWRRPVRARRRTVPGFSSQGVGHAAAIRLSGAADHRA